MHGDVFDEEQQSFAFYLSYKPVALGGIRKGKADRFNSCSTSGFTVSLQRDKAET